MRKASRRKKILFLSILLSLQITAVTLILGGYYYYESGKMYDYVKGPHNGWVGNVHRADPMLGIASNPGAKGSLIFPHAPGFPVRYSDLGFRVPTGDKRKPPFKRPLVLALGCSFTFGAACNAEETFSYLVAKALDGMEINAGFCSWGLAQMLVRAEELIPEYKPDYVLVQYSSWLVDRATQYMAPARFGLVPSPYFSTDENGVQLNPPAFQARIFALPVEKFLMTSESLGDKLAFFFQVGLPLNVYQDFNQVLLGLKRVFGLIPEPTNDKEAVVKFV